MDRPAYKIDADHPGSDVAGEIAAAFAAGSIVYADEGKIQLQTRHRDCIIELILIMEYTLLIFNLKLSNLKLRKVKLINLNRHKSSISTLY